MIYERVIQRKAKGRYLAGNIALIACYAVIALLGVWLLPASLYLAVLCFLVDLVLFLLTNRFLRVEYEYSYTSETLSIAKIYGKRSRRAVLDVDLKATLLTAPNDEENVKRLDRLHVDKVYVCTSSEEAPHTYFTVFEDEEENKILVYFEGDERGLTFFKRANPIVTTVRPF